MPPIVIVIVKIVTDWMPSSYRNVIPMERKKETRYIALLAHWAEAGEYGPGNTLGQQYCLKEKMALPDFFKSQQACIVALLKNESTRNAKMYRVVKDGRILEVPPT